MDAKTTEDIATTMIQDDKKQITYDDDDNEVKDGIDLVISGAEKQGKYVGIQEQRWQKAVKTINDNHFRLESKYGHIVGIGSCVCCKKMGDKFGSLFSFFFVLLPMLLFWLLLTIIIFLFYILTFRFCGKYSFGDYMLLFLGNQRLKLLKSKNKNGICYTIHNRIIGFAQLFDFIKDIIKNSFYESNLRWHRLFGNGKAYPYMFSIVACDYDTIDELVHKPEWDPKRQFDDRFDDRQAKTFFGFEISEEIGWFATPHVFSVSDARHDIMRDLQYICLQIGGKEDYYNLDIYTKNVYQPNLSQLPNDCDKWLEKYLSYPYCKKNYLVLHYAPLMYRFFGIQFTKQELEWLSSAVKPFAFLAMPNWFHFMLFDNVMLRKAYASIHRLTSIIEHRCKNGVLEKLKSYGARHGINERAVLYSVSLMFFFAGGNKTFNIVIERFEKDPIGEYRKYHLNPDRYILEIIRLHAAIVRATSNISHKEYNYMINGKLCTFPKGTMISANLLSINDNIASKFSSEFDSTREDSEYDMAWSFHAKDGLFTQRNGKSKILPSRFCPGRAVAIPHLKQMVGLLMESMKKHFIFDDNDLDPTNNLIDANELHKSLSFYNQVVVDALTPGIRKHNKEDSNDYLHEIITSHKSELSRNNLAFNKIFGKKLLIHDIYVERSKLKDTVFDIITNAPLVFPVEDNNELWDKNSIDNARKMMKIYLKEKCEMPPVNVEWKSLKTDYDMSLLAFGGLLCLYTQYIGGKNVINGINNDIDNPLSKHVPNNACFKSDFTFLYDFEVRKGLHRYGACAYFNEKCELISIYVSHLQSMVYPESDKFSYAKYAWVTSGYTALTLKEHAMICHMTEANALVTNVYYKLPLNHFLRRLLTIFTHRTVYINQGMNQVLLCENGIVHRLYGFTYKAIEKMCGSVLANYQYVPYVERFDANIIEHLKKMEDNEDEFVDSIFPLYNDANDYYKIIYNFVCNYIDTYDITEDFILNDKYCKSFYEGVCNDLKILIDETNRDTQYSKRNLCKLISNLICVVTAYHEQVGTVADNMCADLDWSDTKLYKNKRDKTQMSKNDFVCAAVLIMLTGVRNPRLINDKFIDVLLKDEHYDQNLTTFKAWQNELKELVKKIDEKNEKTRRIAFNSVNPRLMECSVSI